jgi:hypothetical protein
MPINEKTATQASNYYSDLFVYWGMLKQSDFVLIVECQPWFAFRNSLSLCSRILAQPGQLQSAKTAATKLA